MSSINSSEINFNNLPKFNNERCFILGGAPSLKDERLDLLKNEKVFICNKGYKALDIGLDHYDFYVLADASVAKENYQDICNNITSPRFYSSRVTKKVNFNHNYIEFLRGSGKAHVTLPMSFEQGWGKVGTVVLDATIIAYLMGFSEIYLLGTDLDYSADNTHFYLDDPREIRQRNVMNTELVFRNIKGISKQFEKTNIVFKNLSKGFTHSNICQTGKLEDII